VFGYIAHKDGCWWGLMAHDKLRKKEIAEFTSIGCTITPVATRAEYLIKIKEFKLPPHIAPSPPEPAE
jgi:hypothetical protein